MPVKHASIICSWYNEDATRVFYQLNEHWCVPANPTPADSHLRILLIYPENNSGGLQDATPAAKRCLFPLRFHSVFTIAKHLNFKTHPAARAAANWKLAFPCYRGPIVCQHDIDT